MNYYFVTGTSRGIGRALAERLLMEPNNRVVGIARGKGPRHERYRHVTLDLSKPAEVAAFNFEACIGAQRIVLVNNAGMAVGGRLGTLPPELTVDMFNVNIIAPVLLINAFVAAYAATDAQKLVLSISSGAGRNPIPGAAPMSTTKSAIDMLTRVLAAEAALSPERHITALSVAPGIVRTAMYEAVMSAPSDDPGNQAAQERLRSQEVAEPADVAEKLYRLIDRADEFTDALVSLSQV